MRNGSAPRCGCRRFRFLSVRPSRGDNRSGFFIDPADETPFGTGLLLLAVPVGNGLIGVCNPGSFIFLTNNRDGVPLQSSLCIITHNEDWGQRFLQQNPIKSRLSHLFNTVPRYGFWERRIEGCVMCSCIAMGLLQLIALCYSPRVPGLFFRYLRTPSKTFVSEATVMAYLRKSIFRLFARNSHLSITKIIKNKQEMPNFDEDSLVS
ncbi:hypothetical protein PAAL109150_22285 [Paenibacillus alkaliterrae]